MTFRSIASGIMMSKPRATYSIAAVSAGIFPEASRGRLRAAAFCHRPARKKAMRGFRVDQTGRQCLWLHVRNLRGRSIADQARTIRIPVHMISKSCARPG